jgi:GxxExxY protein
MPVTCPITFRRISLDEMRDLDYRVMECAFKTHNDLGSLCDERVYQARFANLLHSAGFIVGVQVPVSLTFRSFSKPLYLDTAVNDAAVYELKTVSALTPAHESQLLNYLFLTNASRGKLINFRPTSLDSRFVNSAMTQDERRRFTVELTKWNGSDEFKLMVTDLMADWGTGLDSALYQQALIHLHGGEDVVTRMLLMKLDGVELASQRFHLLNESTCLHLTTFQDELDGRCQTQIRRLLRPSSLKAAWWVNIARHKVTLTTIKV